MKKKEKLKQPQITETYAIKTPTGEMVAVAKRLTFYDDLNKEDFSFISLNHSWVEMLPKSTMLIPLAHSSYGIHNIKDLLTARFIGELHLRLPKIGANLSKIDEALKDLRQTIKSFKFEE